MALTLDGTAGITFNNSTTQAVAALPLTGGTITGNLVIGSGANGIVFPATQSASSNGNTLDDYEEGTYTATITTDTSGTITLSSSVDLLQYTKIGRLVTITGRVLIASVSSPSGSVRFSLPFATASGTAEQSGYNTFACYTHGVNLTDISRNVFLEAAGGLSYATIFQVRDADSWLALPAANLTGAGNEYIYISGSYITD